MGILEDYNAGNQFGKENNLRLNVVSAGHIEYEMTVEEKHFALPEVMHGGAIAGLMDAVLSVAAFSAVAPENKHVATVEFKINYLKTVSVPGKLKGTGKVVKKGKRVLVCKGEIVDGRGDMVAIGTGTLMPV